MVEVSVSVMYCMASAMILVMAIQFVLGYYMGYQRSRKDQIDFDLNGEKKPFKFIHLFFRRKEKKEDAQKGVPEKISETIKFNS